MSSRIENNLESLNGKYKEIMLYEKFKANNFDYWSNGKFIWSSNSTEQSFNGLYE